MPAKPSDTQKAACTLKTWCTAKLNNKASSAPSKQRSYKTISPNEFHRYTRVSEQHIAGHRYSGVAEACMHPTWPAFPQRQTDVCIYLAASAMLKCTDEESAGGGNGWDMGQWWWDMRLRNEGLCAVEMKVDGLIDTEIRQFIHAAMKCTSSGNKKVLRLLLCIWAAYFLELQCVKRQGVELSALFVRKGEGAWLTRLPAMIPSPKLFFTGHFHLICNPLYPLGYAEFHKRM